MVSRKNFWINEPSVLLYSTNIIPTKGMCINEQMNTVTRLVIVIFVFLLLLDVNKSYIFLIVSILFIIIFHYIKKGIMKNTECYQKNMSSNQPHQKYDYIQTNNSNSTIKYYNNNCGKYTETGDNNPEYISKNQKLVGKANPKTLIPPVIIAPPASLDFWKANNLVSFSAINQETNTDLYASGYAVSECCGGQQKCNINTSIYNEKLIEDFEVPKPVTINPRYEELLSQKDIFGAQKSYKENFQVPKPVTLNSIYNQHKNIEEKYEYPIIKTNKDKYSIVIPNEDGWVNTSCGYNPEQVFTSNLPSNLSTGNCQMNTELSDYNKQIFTQHVGSDDYSFNQINEPINSNIGISFQQQLQPTTVKKNKNGTLLYTEHDPRIIEPLTKKPEVFFDSINESNVYDPRFTGYGTSYRSYNNTLLGQPRFMYDDINAVRMPNYISRSNIDFENFADSYGSLQNNTRNGNENTSSIRHLANESWLNNSLAYRNSLSHSLMRKINAEKWQNRIAPKGPVSFSSGSMSCR